MLTEIRTTKKPHYANRNKKHEETIILQIMGQSLVISELHLKHFAT